MARMGGNSGGKGKFADLGGQIVPGGKAQGKALGHLRLTLSLGRITVQSALGEPLRAEIEVPEINAEEASSLKTSIASPAAFAAAGLEYNAAMASLQATLQRRPDGRGRAASPSGRLLDRSGHADHDTADPRWCH